MSSIRYLPSCDILQAELKRDGIETFYNRYCRYESIIGPSDSCTFVENCRSFYKALQNFSDQNSKQKKGFFRKIYNWILRRKIKRVVTKSLKKL